MKISLEELSKIAKNFLYLLEREGIEKTDELEKRIGTTVKLEKSKDFVIITTRPSNYQTIAHTISYCHPDSGIPIELKINKKLGYARLFVKSEKKLKGYNTFNCDYYNNFIQNKFIESANFLEIVLNFKKELEKICNICNRVK